MAAKKKRPKSPFVPLTKRATARQADYLRAVHALMLRLGRSPSPTEVGDLLGMTRTGARRGLKALEKKGLLRDVPKMVSTGKWTLTDAGYALLEEE